MRCWQRKKEYYQSFVETQKDRVEARLNKYQPEGETVSTVPLLVQRHIVKPERDRLEAQKAKLPPRLKAVFEKVKQHKYFAAAASVGGIGLMSLSIASSFGVGLAAGYGTRKGFSWLLDKQEKRLVQKRRTFEDMFASGELDALGDSKEEYFQELRKIDNRKLASSLTAAGVGMTAGSSMNDFLSDSMFGAAAAQSAEVGMEPDSADIPEVGVGGGGEEGGGGISEEQTQAKDTTEDDRASTVADQGGLITSEDDIDWSTETETQENYVSVSPERLAEIQEKVDARNEWIEKKVHELKSQPVYSTTPEYRMEELAEKLWRHAQYLEISEKMGMDLKPGDSLNFTVGSSGPPSINGEPIPAELYQDILEAERPQDFKWEKSQIVSKDASPGQFEDRSRLEPVTIETERESGYRTDSISESNSEQPDPSTESVTPLVEDLDVRLQELLQDVSASPYEVQAGDNIWNILENKLNTSGLFQGLDSAEQTYLIDALKDKVTEMSEEELRAFGVSSGDPNVIQVGEELDFSRLIDEQGLREALQGAEELTEAEKININAYVPSADSGAEIVSEQDSAVRPTAEPVPVQSTEVPESINAEGVVEAVPTEFVAEHQKILESDLGNREKTDGLFYQNESFDVEWLTEYDNEHGYNPKYTEELLKRQWEMPGTEADPLALRNLIHQQMIEAYSKGEVTLPAQLLYYLDMRADVYGYSSEGLPQDIRDTPRIAEFAEKGDYKTVDAIQDFYQANRAVFDGVSSEELRSVGVTSGNWKEWNHGDSVNVGELIKIIMEKYAERINLGVSR